MTREEAIHNISVATDELEEIVERMAKTIEALCLLPIVNIHNFNTLIEKPARKSYVSPYAKFDKIRRKRK